MEIRKSKCLFVSFPEWQRIIQQATTQWYHSLLWYISSKLTLKLYHLHDTRRVKAPHVGQHFPLLWIKILLYPRDPFQQGNQNYFCKYQNCEVFWVVFFQEQEIWNMNSALLTHKKTPEVTHLRQCQRRKTSI